MVIEDIRIKSDLEIGNRLVVTGRSLESLLDRRIVWGQTNLNGSLQDCIKKLIDDSIISPEDTRRAINNFKFVYTADRTVNGISVNAQFTGANLYDAIKKLCDSYDVGFKIVLTDDNMFAMSMYAGADRSYNQTENPYVVFSPEFENLINSNYYASKKEHKRRAVFALFRPDVVIVTNNAAFWEIDRKHTPLTTALY